MSEEQCEIGMIGLGVMGRNLLLNIAERGFTVAGFDKDAAQVARLQQEAGRLPVVPCRDLARFLAVLRRPRAVLLLVPAGPPVDAVLHELQMHLAEGDVVIDGGNSYFADTDRRRERLAEDGLLLLGLGVSGGEAGARRGPSMMPGGPLKAYERVRPVLEAAAAKVGNEPCVTWLGPGSAGHYVKMVHNGIEYALMQLIAESYDLLHRGLGLGNAELAGVYRDWNGRELAGFLIEISAAIFEQPDPKGGLLIDAILDAARQKGTGMWTSRQALDLQVPTPGIDMAVMMRDLSALREERKQAAGLLPGPVKGHGVEHAEFLPLLERGLYAAFLIAFAQGMALLQRASSENGYGLKLAEVARIWRGGCIIRAALLEELRAAFADRPVLPNLLLDERTGRLVAERQRALRQVVQTAAALGIPAPGLMSALAYYDGYRSARLPTNLVQAQRDFFGAHTYERRDGAGTFHTEWNGGER